MKSLTNGERLGGISVIKGADKTAINLMLISDDGEAIDITGDTLAVEIHPRAGRGETPIVTLAGTIVVAEAGTFTVTPTDTDTNLLSVGSYYYWVKHTESGGLVFMDGPGVLTVT